MKKNIVLKNDSLSKFETSEITALSTVTGGSDNDPGGTMTLGYTTSSSKDDSDTGDHDSDAS